MRLFRTRKKGQKPKKKETTLLEAGGPDLLGTEKKGISPGKRGLDFRERKAFSQPVNVKK